ncbi:OmpP1/FadL family transporter [Falsihalocynthiibacter arcticus]|uniref:OmpP1/FadL family transporter n=1 Tax=Falsihalocynthiibacter arcticus TaxID=1579316 RepID=UPI001F1E9D74|nr:outer membrane protein transport protein [Falsihalocynthiibacter arcticus]
MAPAYTQFSGAYKHSFSDKLDAAIIIDEPFGADVAYPSAPYFATGSVAELNTAAITGILKYNINEGYSVFGGLRYETLEATANIPFVSSYDAVGSKNGAFGYLVGAAYERPDIALRVALTYNSKISHDLETTESSAALGADNTSVTEVNSPQSVNLEFQSGVAEDTLVFGSIRWVNWSDYDISPTDYATLTGGGSLVSYEDDVFTYTLGVGRKFSDSWSGAISAGYEKSNGGYQSNLNPTDGQFSVGLGGTYTRENMKITAGVKYVMIGDAETTLGLGGPASSFQDNNALAFGLRIGLAL